MKTARHSFHSITLCAGAYLLLAGCSWNSPYRDTAAPRPVVNPERTSANTKRRPVHAPARQTSTTGVRIAEVAAQMVGVPYVYGGRSPSRGFDCSGLVYYAHQKLGVAVPRTAAQQQKNSRPVQLDNVRPGDLLFFRETRKVSHVAIYVGDNRFIHAPSSGKKVSYASLDQDYYRRHFSGAGRLH